MKLRHEFIAYTALVLALLAGAGWCTHTLLNLQEQNRKALRQADYEARVRTALMRMDSKIAPLVLREAERPRNDYQAFTPAPMFVANPPLDCPPPMIPSPLLKQTPRHVVMHFTCEGTNQIVRSPQIPETNLILYSEGVFPLHHIVDSCACETLEHSLLVSNRATGAASENMRALWVDDMLLLARPLFTQGLPEIQAAWLNWPRLQQDLLASIEDLFPEARLEPLMTDQFASPSRRLASLPIRFVPGRAGRQVAVAGVPLSMPLSLIWTGLLLAVGALGILLWGTIRQSRRQADFVSAVSHELRTPLTSFRLNTELLADGTVSDPTGQQRIFSRLQSESQRLTHLVDNVLAFASIEQGSQAPTMETTTLHTLLIQHEAALRERAERDDFEIQIEADADEAVTCNADLVGQILMNLVDNSCKYAGKTGNKIITLRTGPASIEVQDQGPGVPATERSNLFRPFHKSAQATAGKAPGVGLGLALCRQMARRMQADLTYGEVAGGACFRLSFES